MDSTRVSKVQTFKKKSGKGVRGIAQPRSFWVKQRDALDLSGLKAKDFCAAHGLAYSTFTKWMGILRKEDTPHKGKFVRVQVEDHSTLPEAAQQKPAHDFENNAPSSTTLALEVPVTHQIDQMARTPDLKLCFGKGLTLHIPLGFDTSTLRDVVETLA